MAGCSLPTVTLHSICKKINPENELDTQRVQETVSRHNQLQDFQKQLQVSVNTLTKFIITSYGVTFQTLLLIPGVHYNWLQWPPHQNHSSPINYLTSPYTLGSYIRLPTGNQIPVLYTLLKGHSEMFQTAVGSVPQIGNKSWKQHFKVLHIITGQPLELRCQETSTRRFYPNTNNVASSSHPFQM